MLCVIIVKTLLLPALVLTARDYWTLDSNGPRVSTSPAITARMEYGGRTS